MTIASRTPEGLPHVCSVCGNVAALEPSSPGGDSCCPSCGQLLWWFRDKYGDPHRVAAKNITMSTSIAEMAGDSLESVEMVMELEEEFGIRIPDTAAEQFATVGDAIRYIEQARRAKTP